MSSVSGDDANLRWVLARREHELVVSLLQELVSLLEDPDTDDDVVARLFPAAVEGDDEADAELRRLLHGDLLATRQDAVRAVLAALTDAPPGRGGRVTITLDRDRAGATLRALNDVRLALATRVGLTTSDRDGLGEDARPALELVDLLGWYQAQLLEVLDPGATAYGT